MLTKLAVDERKTLTPNPFKKSKLATLNKLFLTGTSNEKDSREDVENAISAQYKHTGLQQPNFLWCPCPMSAGISANLLINSASKFLCNEAYGIFNKSYSVEQFCNELLNTPDENYNEKTIKNIADAIKRVGIETGHLTKEQLLTPANTNIPQNRKKFIHVGDKFFDIFGNSEDIDCNYWYALDSLVLLCDRPTVIKHDKDGKLHADDGPAFMFVSGWGLWFNHGVKIDRKKMLTNGDDGCMMCVRNDEMNRKQF